MKSKAAARKAVIIITCILAIFTGANSCKKKSEPAAMGTFYFHIHTKIDTNEVANGNTLYRDSTGRHFSLSVAQFYISGVKLHNVTGSYYTIPNSIVLKSLDSEQYVIGQAPAGTYDGVSFTVGLDPATNVKTPGEFSNTGYIANSSMWFGNTTDGYMYLQAQGMADTTATQTGANLVPFSYKLGAMPELGGDLDLKTVTMSMRTGALKPYTLFGGSSSYIHLNCDYGKLLSGVNFKSQDSADTHSSNNTNTAIGIAGKIPDMFLYEE
jgi:hypothetical protein